ncbi:MAG: hypothetical protein PHF35_00020 [Candidatus Moranbacteria bacterium]|nr:hypothetical protein [Candidatus Moranbacteria bacterium]
MTKSERKKIIKETFSGTQVGMILEDMQDGIKLIGEQHGHIVKKIDNMENRFDKLEDRFDKLENRFDGLENKLDNFIQETGDNFKAVFEYLSRIEDDFIALTKKIEKLDIEKVSVNDFNWLKDKVLEIEKRLDNYKKRETALAPKS